MYLSLAYRRKKKKIANIIFSTFYRKHKKFDRRSNAYVLSYNSICSIIIKAKNIRHVIVGNNCKYLKFLSKDYKLLIQITIITTTPVKTRVLVV